jgi:glycosyltransferase involved in cell wall biosynthesis
MTTETLNLAVLWMMDFSGSRFLNGGLERWCRDLARLAQSKGYRVAVYQKAPRPFTVELPEGITVTGVECSLRTTGHRRFSKWLEQHLEPADPLVYVSQELALSGKLRRCVTVNHGIWWDGDYPAWKKLVLKRLHARYLRTARSTICVDTNYINWCHAELPGRVEWQGSLAYIPNYADAERFHPSAAGRGAEGPVHLVFPRRIPEDSLNGQGRGAGFLLQALDILLERSVPFRVSFVGPASDGAKAAINEWAARRGDAGLAQQYEVPMDQMPEVYDSADVVVVPTVAHEGTSLAAIEGIMSGKPTVVTHIGGLPNVVIDGLTGFMCDLTPASLADSIIRAIGATGHDSTATLEAARSTFSKSRWEKAVWTHLEASLHLRPGPEPQGAQHSL